MSRHLSRQGIAPGAKCGGARLPFLAGYLLRASGPLATRAVGPEDRCSISLLDGEVNWLRPKNKSPHIDGTVLKGISISEPKEVEAHLAHFGGQIRQGRERSWKSCGSW